MAENSGNCQMDYIQWSNGTRDVGKYCFCNPKGKPNPKTNAMTLTLIGKARTLTLYMPLTLTFNPSPNHNPCHFPGKMLTRENRRTFFNLKNGADVLYPVAQGQTNAEKRADERKQKAEPRP